MHVYDKFSLWISISCNLTIFEAPVREAVSAIQTKNSQMLKECLGLQWQEEKVTKTMKIGWH